MPARREAPAITPAKRMLTAKQVAEVYSVTVQFIKKQPADELPKIRLGHRTVLFDVDDVEAFFRRRKTA